MDEFWRLHSTLTIPHGYIVHSITNEGSVVIATHEHTLVYTLGCQSSVGLTSASITPMATTVGHVGWCFRDRSGNPAVSGHQVPLFWRDPADSTYVQLCAPLLFYRTVTSIDAQAAAMVGGRLLSAAVVSTVKQLHRQLSRTLIVSRPRQGTFSTVDTRAHAKSRISVTISDSGRVMVASQQ